MTVSFLGDGIFFIALAWQVYGLSNTPTALSVVLLGMTGPQVAFLLLGGVLTDRFERRKIMIAADVVRWAAVTGIGVLAVAGRLELRHVIVLAAVYGAGEAFFGPAFGAIVPDLVPTDLLVQANSLDQFVRPFALQLAGPALGGAVVAATGPGTAFLVDGGTFVFSAACLLVLTSRPFVSAERLSVAGAVHEIREGFGFVRSHTWLWGTLVAAAVTLLFTYGPNQVLLPFVVKNGLGGGAGDLGLVFAAGGVGSLLAAVVVGQRDLPRRHVTTMYVAWTVAVAVVAAYGLATGVGQAMAIMFVRGVGIAVGTVIWATLMHRLVPTALLGRVTSFDWFLSIGLIPVSFAATGPIAGAIGTKETLVGAGVFGSVITLAFLFLPRMRETERTGALRPGAGL
jgi:Transmembrane secretion effector